MRNLYARQATAFRNEMKQSCAALVGIVQGVLSDGTLNDQEVMFLNRWLEDAHAINGIWPGSSLHAKIREALSDGQISVEERQDLIQFLEAFVGDKLESSENSPVTTLAFDEVAELDFFERTFCLTGNFAFGGKSACESAIQRRGGSVSPTVTKKLNFLVVGGLGSPEWKHASFGTKIERAMEYRTAGASLRIVHEDVWASSLGSTPKTD